MTEDESPNRVPSLMVTEVERTNQNPSPMEIEDCNNSDIVRGVVTQDDVFMNRMYSSTNDVLLTTLSGSSKRPAQCSPSPNVPRKRLSTSSNDIATAEIVENKLTKNMKQPRNSLNLSLPVEKNNNEGYSVNQQPQQHSRPNHLNIPANPARLFGTTHADRFNLHRSISTKSFRNKKNLRRMRSLATTPTTPAAFNPMTPTKMGGLMTPRITRTLTLSARHTTSLNRTYSVRTPTRPAVLRRLNSDTNGSISHLHSSQLNRTNSGFFKRRTLSTCTLVQTPTLRRNGSCRIVSSKVKRCQSTKVSLLNTDLSCQVSSVNI